MYSNIVNGSFPLEVFLGGGNKTGTNDLTQRGGGSGEKRQSVRSPGRSGVAIDKQIFTEDYDGTLVKARSEEELRQKLRELQNQDLRDRYFRKALQQSLNFSF